MKKTTLQNAYSILESASAVVIDDSIVYPNLTALDGDGDHEFMTLTWEDDEGQEFTASFTEAANQTPEVVGSDLWLVDSYGDPTQITILVPAADLESRV